MSKPKQKAMWATTKEGKWTPLNRNARRATMKQQKNLTNPEKIAERGNWMKIIPRKKEK